VKRLQNLVYLALLGLVAAAVYEQLQKPPEQRTWQGRLFGVVPYDFRVPTLQTVKDAYWNPENPSFFGDKVLGLGWGINFYRVWQWLKGLTTQTAS
jgi:hypothetical protein